MLTIQATYQKRLGLPGYSSHAYTVSVTAEISSLRKLQSENQRLYRLLQGSVDEQLKTIGFMPENTYGINGKTPRQENGSAIQPAPAKRTSDGVDEWACSEKQRKFIELVAKRERFTPSDLDNLAQRVCDAQVRQLDKRQASKFIGELLNISAPLPFRKNERRQTSAVANDAAA
jgi:hypothetical protein